MALFAENFLKGYEIGRNRKRQEELDKERAEDRKLEIQKHKLLLDRLKIQDKEEARKSARSEIDWMSTQPGVELPGPTEDGSPLVAQRHAPMVVPEGGYGQPAMTVVPQTRQATLAAQLAEKIKADRAARMRMVDPAMAKILDVAPGEHDVDVFKAAADRGNTELVQEMMNTREQMGNAAAMARERAGNATQLQVAEINARGRGPAVVDPAEADHWAKMLASGEIKMAQVPIKQRAAIINHMFGSNMAIMTPAIEGKLDQFMEANASVDKIEQTLNAMNAPDVSGTEKAALALQYQAEISALSRGVGRALGEKGVFTDQDKRDFEKIIGFGSGVPGGAAAAAVFAPDLAKQRIENLRGFMAKVKQDRIDSFMQRTGGRAAGGMGGPKVGDRKTFKNGKVGEWDGNGWVEVK